MTNTTTTIQPITFKKLNDGTWGIQGSDLRPGDAVTVTKANGETKQVIVGEVMPFVTGFGNNVARIAQAPRPVVADKVTEIGFYLHEGVAYKVVKSGIGRLYAKRVTSRGFVYDEGAISTLSASELMTAEEVRVYSRSCGICANCSVELSDPISVEIGLGTHCGPGILGRDNYKVARKAARLVPWVAEALAKIKAEKAAEKAMKKAAEAADNAAAEAEGVADLLAHFGA